MYYSGIAECDVLNGTGFRVVLFVSGCENYCSGCHNQKAWDYTFGHPFTDKTKEYIYDCLSKPYIDGISILGGDPFAPKNRQEVCNFIADIRAKFGTSKNIWVWTGYTLEEVEELNIPVNNIDVMIDGRYEKDKRDVSLKFRGSSNQRILHNTDKGWRDVTDEA